MAKQGKRLNETANQIFVSAAGSADIQDAVDHPYRTEQVYVIRLSVYQVLQFAAFRLFVRCQLLLPLFEQHQRSFKPF
ncbi:unnamed protein product [Soboliphyme baturini]|uniref:Transcriptional regulator n=1 Tax=Soboliphyme baturini TaxID=241478 RepID=A0A183IV47_9BILA|nr:unnamed protein product [Soboliphyme baturini]